jgi:hypothetical protein
MVKLQEAENQIVVAYEVYDRRPSDSDLLLAAIETHQATLGLHAAPGGGGCRLLLGQERGGRESQGRQARLHPQPLSGFDNVRLGQVSLTQQTYRRIFPRGRSVP